MSGHLLRIIMRARVYVRVCACAGVGMRGRLRARGF